ncbi:MAG: anhydro-N-acetylmuramic acid kinase [Methylococcales bacterium]|nr:anhydro-N-acetylmuramic acid kinase [Methylococcales bacterium]
MSDLYIGLMSGTSLDGIDAALVEFKEGNIQLIEFEYFPFTKSIIKDIQELSQPDTAVSLKKYGSIDAQLGTLFAQASNQLLNKAKVNKSQITAIGSHGQTIYHSPNSNPALSLQIGDPNIIAEQTGITTVADFRRRDIAAGGQGAPLVPAFHHAFFSNVFDLSKQNICIVNIGGIANITYLSINKTIGFDTGPGNTLMDYWIEKHLKSAYDKNGAWAKSGRVDTHLLDTLKQDAYFQLAPPKSTGKEYFSPRWLNNAINSIPHYKPEDIQSTLCQLTADTITDSIQHYAPKTDITLICGGGIHNDYLVHLIQKNLNHPVSSTEKYGIRPDHVEAIAFAWLARQTMNHLPGNLTKVTGAKSAVILGGIYPA